MIIKIIYKFRIRVFFVSSRGLTIQIVELTHGARARWAFGGRGGDKEGFGAGVGGNNNCHRKKIGLEEDKKWVSKVGYNTIKNNKKKTKTKILVKN